MIYAEKLSGLSPRRRRAILARSTDDLTGTRETTLAILERLKADPEKELLREYGHLKENLSLADFRVGPGELEEARSATVPAVLSALRAAMANIESFHRAQLGRPLEMTEVAPGILAGRVTRPLEKVGVYVPGGRAAYPSSALMNIVPARVAGCGHIAAATPPGPGLRARGEILAACALAGATEIYKLGGAWAVGALAFGLGGLPRVDKIVGPGSSWVTEAKMAVFGQVDIDQPAGPSEGFIIADGTAQAAHLAWDFMSQLEHDPQASAVLVSTCSALASEVAALVRAEAPRLDRAGIVGQSLSNAAILEAQDLGEAFDFANEYAPEHLQLAIAEALSHLGRVRNAGSVFLGPWSPIPAGDYASGPNHVLPTGGSARAFSGLSADSFLKKISFQQLSFQAMSGLAPTVSVLARAEGLPAHARCLEVRLAGGSED
ncbi:MAG: histidinol dehydrogenase [Deltaproteobacteria bacterium]|jgi:histidinol dehydrogenase|nr:histidinol dehydrogenase [Deltaproteobacteria bacterium]